MRGYIYFELDLNRERAYITEFIRHTKCLFLSTISWDPSMIPHLLHCTL